MSTNACFWGTIAVIVGIVLTVIVVARITARTPGTGEVASTTTPAAVQEASTTPASLTGSESTSPATTPQSVSTSSVKPVGSGTKTGTAQTPPPPPSAEITLPYSQMILAVTYEIGWRATEGKIATIALIKDGVRVATIKACANMPVVPNTTQYCAWTQALLPTGGAASGYTFELTVIGADGTTVSRATTNTISFLSHSDLSLTPHQDSMFGWTVRYPDGWLKKTSYSQTIFAQDANALSAPLSSREAFVIEYCSMAHGTCSKRVQEFGGAASSLGGKSTKMHVTRENGTLVRTDMLTSNGIAFFISRNASNAQGTVISPYVRESLATFGYTTARVSVGSYSLKEAGRAGGLTFEYLDTVPVYLRLYTGAYKCASDIETATFTLVNPHNFIFTKNGCTLQGATEDTRGAFEVTERDCETLYTGVCAFRGTYMPVQ